MTDDTFPFPLPARPKPSLEKAKQLLRSVRGAFSGLKNEEHQAVAIQVMADGQRQHYISYVAEAAGTYRDGIRVERLAVAMYEETGKIHQKPEGMDRELVRDYVLKPLLELGVIVEATWTREGRRPVLRRGHVTAKSQNSVYRLSDLAILALDEANAARTLEIFESIVQQLPEKTVERLALQEAIQATQKAAPHGQLLRACVEVVRRYLPDFEVVFMDLSDGQRISAEYQTLLGEHGLSLTLQDNLPDAILASKKRKLIIAVEAVTSDGEFDAHREDRLHKWAHRHRYELAAAITAYPNYKLFGDRQAAHKNLGMGTFVWILDEPEALYTKQLTKTTLRDATDFRN